MIPMYLRLSGLSPKPFLPHLVLPLSVNGKIMDPLPGILGVTYLGRRCLGRGVQFRDVRISWFPISDAGLEKHQILQPGIQCSVSCYHPPDVPAPSFTLPLDQKWSSAEKFPDLLLWSECLCVSPHTKFVC